MEDRGHPGLRAEGRWTDTSVRRRAGRQEPRQAGPGKEHTPVKSGIESFFSCAGDERVFIALIWLQLNQEEYMTKRIALSVLGLLLIASCEMSTDSPTAPGMEFPAQFAISDGANQGNPFFFFLPPMVKQPGATGVFDGTASPKVQVCRLYEEGGSADEVCDEGYTVDLSSGVTVGDDLYQVDWKTDLVAVGDVWRVSVFFDNTGAVELGYADLAFPESKGRAKNLSEYSETIVLNDGQTLPIKFRIEEFADVWEECDPLSDPDILDCDVVLVREGTGGAVFVQDPDGMGLAAAVNTPPLSRPYLLTLNLLPVDVTPPAPGIPADDQIPYFVDVSALYADGTHVNFLDDGADGAELILCQYEGDGRHLYNWQDLRLFRVDETGEVYFHPEDDTSVAPECIPGYSSGIALLDDHGHPTGHSPFDVFLDRGKRALASVLLPQPLHAVHGGLNGSGIPNFSTWGAAVVESPPPVTITDVSFTSTEMVLGGAPVDFTVTIENSSGADIGTSPPLTDRVAVQALLYQGTYEGAAGGTNVACEGFLVAGTLPPGTCTHAGTFYINNPGAFSPGEAIARIEVRHENAAHEWTTLASYDVPVTLVDPDLPDLVVSSITLPAGVTEIVYGASPATWVTFTVRNDGGPIDPSTLPQVCDGTGLCHGVLRVHTVDATRTADGVTTTYEDAYFGYMNIAISDTFNTGDEISNSFAVGHDTTWPAGDWVIHVEVDPHGVVTESNEANNVSASLSFTVIDPPVQQDL